jgi:hypothetical protein
MQFIIYGLSWLKRDNKGHVSFFPRSPVPKLQCTHIRHIITYSVHESLLNGQMNNQLHTSRARTLQASVENSAQNKTLLLFPCYFIVRCTSQIYFFDLFFVIYSYKIWRMLVNRRHTDLGAVWKSRMHVPQPAPLSSCFCVSTYGSTALCWALAAFSVSWSFTQSVGLLGRGESGRRKAAACTQNNTNTE